MTLFVKAEDGNQKNINLESGSLWFSFLLWPLLRLLRCRFHYQKIRSCRPLASSVPALRRAPFSKLLRAPQCDASDPDVRSQQRDAPTLPAVLDCCVSSYSATRYCFRDHLQGDSMKEHLPRWSDGDAQAFSQKSWQNAEDIDHSHSN